MSNEHETIYHEEDGNLVLFKRPRSPYYYCRIKLPYSGKWKKFSTKTSDQEKAIKVAREQYSYIKFKLEEGLILDTRRFKDVAKIAIKEMEDELAAGAGKVSYKSYIPLIKLMAEYFGNKYISRITHADLHAFLKTRQDNARGERLGRSTINNYKASLSKVYDVAVREGWIYPNQAFTFQNEGKATERRPAFTTDEVKHLIKFMEGYAAETTAGGVSWRTVEIRKLLRDYVEFILYTGLRPGREVEQIKWKHIRIEEHSDGNEYFRITIQKAKTKKREIIAQPEIQRCLDRLARRYNERKRVSPQVEDESGDVVFKVSDLLGSEDYVFRLPDGSFPKDFSGAFDIMLDKAELTFDQNEQKRTLYSLRHTYATLQLIRGVDIHLLALSMGTSIKMLEKHYSHLEVWHNASMLSGTGVIDKDFLNRDIAQLFKDQREIKKMMKKLVQETATEEFIEQDLLHD